MLKIYEQTSGINPTIVQADKPLSLHELVVPYPWPLYPTGYHLQLETLETLPSELSAFLITVRRTVRYNKHMSYPSKKMCYILHE